MGLFSGAASLRLVFACAAAALFLLSVPAYFAARRPRRGTTEWIARLDRPHFAPLTAQDLKWTDAPWAVLAALCAAAGYAGTLILSPAALWYAPFFLGAYVWTQLLRFRGGAEGHRGGKLAASLLLTVPAAACAALCVALVRYVRAGQAASVFEALRSFRFYEGLLPTLRDGLPALVRGGVRFCALAPQTVVLAAAALGALVPLVHGALRLRDGRRLFVLCLLPFALCAWLLGGSAPAAAALLLPVGVLWQSYAARDRAVHAVCYFCAALALTCAGITLF